MYMITKPALSFEEFTGAARSEQQQHKGLKEPEVVAVSERFYLTLPEAVALSGLSKSFLLRKIRDGSLAAFKDWKWKIKRADLENFKPDKKLVKRPRHRKPAH